MSSPKARTSPPSRRSPRSPLCNSITTTAAEPPPRDDAGRRHAQDRPAARDALLAGGVPGLRFDADVQEPQGDRPLHPQPHAPEDGDERLPVGGVLPIFNTPRETMEKILPKD